MKLLLFDIDGTLVHTAGAGLRAIDRAFEKIYGHATSLDGISLAGRTDVRILMDVYKKAGIAFSFDELERLKSVYFELLAEELKNGQKKLMPGVAELIPALVQNENYCHALLTGNWQHSGRLKLKACGLNDFFPFGAFADDAVERVDLVPVAMERFYSEYGYKPHPKDVYVIGDTPSDILCAKPHGVVSVAIAAASYSMDELAAYEPDILLEDLSGENGSFINIINSVNRGRD